MNIRHLLKPFCLALMILSTTCFAATGDYNNRNPASVGLVYRIVDEAIAQISSEPTVSVGDLYQGGIVFYVDSTRRHGLAVSLQNQATNVEMAGSGTNRFPVHTNGIGAGMINSTLIASQFTISDASAVLNTLNAAYEADGTTNCSAVATQTSCFSGWYIGSPFEYQLISANFNVIDTAITQNGGTAIGSGSYWTSLAVPSTYQNIYIINMSTGAIQSTFQDNPFSARGIRQF